MALLTTAEIREIVTTALGEDALQMLLDAAETAITARAGAAGTVLDVRRGGGTLILLSHRAASITSVVEADVLALDQDDYALDAEGYSVERLATGPNPALRWSTRVAVTYETFDDTADRKRVQLELVKLDLTYSPGLTGTTIGAWSEQYATGGAYAASREEILASLGGSPWGFA